MSKDPRCLALLALGRSRGWDGPTDYMRELGRSRSFWSDRLSGDRPIGEKLARSIEDALDLPRYALDNPPSRVAEPDSERHPPVSALRQHATKSNTRRLGGVSVDLLAVEASMGLGVSAREHDEVVTSMVISEVWLRQNAAFSSPQNLSLITGIGTSMEPTFSDGDVLLVDRGVTEVKVESIYVMALQDELYIKRMQRMPDGSLLMLSDNKLYEPMRISGNAREQFRVLGRVVMAWNARRV